MLEHVIEIILEYIIPICEMMGIFVVTISAFSCFLSYLESLVKQEPSEIKNRLARGMALSLEFKMCAEILKTVLVKNKEELMVLGAVIILRAMLAFMIHIEMKEDQMEKAKE